MDPVSKLLLVMVVAIIRWRCQTVVHQVKRRLAAHCLPVFLTDGLAHYKLALLTHFGGGRWLGRAVKPRWFRCRAWCMLKSSRRCAGGDWYMVKQRLSLAAWRRCGAAGALGWKINTAFVERLNLSIRQHVAALGRRC